MSEGKVTTRVYKYYNGLCPDIINPKEYQDYRYALGRKGNNPLVAICMNPSAANEESSDRTINRIIKISQTLGMEGWVVFNLYPERATNAKYINKSDPTISQKNIKVIKEFLTDNNIKEVWGAWGNDNGIEALKNGKSELLKMLSDIGVKVFYFGTLTKSGNPRHPLQRQEKWDFSEPTKHYL